MKLGSESWDGYYYDKVEMVRACGVTGRYVRPSLVNGMRSVGKQKSAWCVFPQAL